MAMEYFCCFHDYRRKVAKLSDQEVGRLFRALMLYSETGEAQELAGRESIAFDFIAADIDRAKNAYQEKCRLNSEKGKLGGRPKKAAAFPESPESQEEEKQKEEEKEKEEKKEKALTGRPPKSPKGDFASPSFSKGKKGKGGGGARSYNIEDVEAISHFDLPEGFWD